MIKAIKLIGELIYDIASVSTGYGIPVNFDNEENKRNWRESQKPLPRGVNHNSPNWPGDHYGG